MTISVKADYDYATCFVPPTIALHDANNTNPTKHKEHRKNHNRTSAAFGESVIIAHLIFPQQFAAVCAEIPAMLFRFGRESAKTDKKEVKKNIHLHNLKHYPSLF